MGNGFIVGIVLAVAILCAGIVGLLTSNHKKRRNKWAWIAIIFSICALISALVNLGVIF